MTLSKEVHSTLRNIFGDKPPSLIAEFCLNVCHKDVGCSRCIDVCPVNAIEFHGTRPRLEADVCISCGQCAAQCPTDALRRVDVVDVRLCQTAAQRPGQPLALACPLLPTSSPSTPAPVAATIRYRRCLAALDIAELLTLCEEGNRPIWLDDRHCASCPIGHGRNVLKRQADTINSLLTVCARPKQLFFVTTVGDEAKPRPLIDGMQPKLSRRELFGALRRRVESRVVDVTSTSETKDDELSTQRQALLKRVPDSRRRLLSGLLKMRAKASATLTADLPFVMVHINSEKCSGCTLCATFCPTGALSFVSDESSSPQDSDSFRLEFTPGRCINCDICNLACPDDAVGYHKPAAGYLLHTLASHTVMMGQMGTCAQCGTPTAVTTNNGKPVHCYICRRSTNLNDPSIDDLWT